MKEAKCTGLSSMYALCFELYNKAVDLLEPLR